MDKNNSNEYFEFPPKEKNKGNFFITFLLIIIAVGIGYLCYSDYQERHPSQTFDSSHKVLVLILDDGSASYSDSTQFKNALADGGQIIINDSNAETMDECIGFKEWRAYGASNKENYLYLNGALLNYIASRGWNLIQAPSTGISSAYYFIR